jgi:hypothetical protein
MAMRLAKASAAMMRRKNAVTAITSRDAGIHVRASAMPMAKQQAAARSGLLRRRSGSIVVA